MPGVRAGRRGPERGAGPLIGGIRLEEVEATCG